MTAATTDVVTGPGTPSVSRTNGRGALRGVIGVVVAIAAWQLVVWFGLVDPEVLPAPLDVVRDAALVVPVDQIVADARVSLTRVVLGFAIGGALGAATGLVTGWYVTFGRWVKTPIELLRPIPPLAWISVAIVWFGVSEASRVFIIGVAAFFPLYTSAYAGAASIDRDLVNAARSLGLRGPRLLLRVALPASLPDIAVGMRLGWGLAFGVLVAAEIIGADTGLGSLISGARQQGDNSLIVYGIVVIGVLTLLTDLVLRLLLARALRWAPSHR